MPSSPNRPRQGSIPNPTREEKRPSLSAGQVMMPLSLKEDRRIPSFSKSVIEEWTSTLPRDLWGKETYEAEETILQKIGKKGAGAMVIGPAGENLVRFAVIESERWRSLGRAGIGAVMGSKKLKGIVFHGTKRRDLADRPASKKAGSGVQRTGPRYTRSSPSIKNTEPRCSSPS